MKGLILIATVLCITNFGAAQDDYFPKIQCLFQSDIVIGGEVMRLKSKEIYQNNQNKFVFQVILNDTSSSTFEILAEDFVEGLYLKNLFVTKLKNVYFGFSSPTIEQKDIDEIFRMVAEKKDSASLTDFNKVKLISIIQKAASTPRIRKGVIINTLKPIFNIYKTKKDRDWISDEINKVDPVLQSQYDIIVKNLEDSSDAYLQNINKVINKLRSRGPEIGVLFTMEKINIYQYNNKSKRDFVTDILDIHQVVIKFENSQIIGIKVKGTVVDSTEATVIFQNRVPLSYSTKADVSNDYYANKGKRIKLYHPNEKLNSKYIFFDETVFNDYRQNNYTENYSPIDTIITLKPFEPGKVIYKEKTTDLLQARIYTDLLGYGKHNPNGLVQAEISKKIFIRTATRQLNKFFTNGYGYFGLFNYIIPSLSITKTEKNNKYFAPPGLPISIDSLMNNDQPVEVKTMDLLRYGNLFSGDEINIVYFGFPKIHSVFHYSIGSDLILSGINKTSEVQDTGKTTLFSFSDEFNVASLSFSPVIVRWDLTPHPNYRVYLSYYLTRLEALDSRIIQSETGRGRWFQQLSFLTAIKFDEEANGELFFRSRLSMNLKEKKEIFFQVQLGYSFKVFTGKPKYKNRVVFHDVF